MALSNISGILSTQNNDTSGFSGVIKQNQDFTSPSSGMGLSQDEFKLAETIKSQGGTEEDIANNIAQYREYKKTGTIQGEDKSYLEKVGGALKDTFVNPIQEVGNVLGKGANAVIDSGLNVLNQYGLIGTTKEDIIKKYGVKPELADKILKNIQESGAEQRTVEKVNANDFVDLILGGTMIGFNFMPGIGGIGKVGKFATSGIGASSLISAGSVTPGIQDVIKPMGEGIQTLGGIVSQLPGLSDIQDNLDEEHKQKMNMLIGMGVLPPLMKGAGKLNKAVGNPVGKVTGVIGDIGGGIIGGTKNKIMDLYEKSKGIFSPNKTLDEAIGQIIQGDTKDIGKATHALGMVDTTGVKTYQDLYTKISEYQKTVMQTLDAELLKNQTKYTLDDFTQYFGEGTQKTQVNYVREALMDLKELYSKTRDPENLQRIESLLNKDEFTLKDVNDISREYNSDFGKKAFSKTSGDPLTSVMANTYENTRSGLKDAVRLKMPNDTAIKSLDYAYHEMANTQRLIEKMIEKVHDFQNKINNLSLGRKIGGYLADGLDLMSGGILKGAFYKLTARNQGYKMLNYYDLQKELPKNLAIIKDILSKKGDDFTKSAKEFVDNVNQSMSQDVMDLTNFLETYIKENKGNPEVLKELLGDIDTLEIPDKMKKDFKDRVSQDLENANQYMKDVKKEMLNSDEALISHYGQDLYSAFKQLYGIEQRTKRQGKLDIFSKIEQDGNGKTYEKFKMEAETYLNDFYKEGKTEESIQQLYDDMKDIIQFHNSRPSDVIDSATINPVDNNIPNDSLPDFLRNTNDSGIIDSKKVNTSSPEEVNTLFNEYKSKFKEGKTVILDSDNIKKLFTDYDPKKPEDVHGVSSDLTKKFFPKFLDEIEGGDVVFTMGGGGSGKSEILVNKAKNDGSEFIVDGTGKNFDVMKSYIEQSREKGKNPKIKVVYVDFDVAKKFNEKRDRRVPEEFLLKTHEGYRKSLVKLLNEFPDIDVEMTMNLGYRDKAGDIASYSIPKDQIIDFIESRTDIKSKVEK